MTRPLWLFDLDMTLCENNHRAEHILKENPDWDTYHRPDLMAKDVPMPWTRALWYEGKFKYGDFGYLTARDVRAHEPTLLWLETHGFGLPPTCPLYMKRISEERGVHWKVRKILSLLEEDEDVFIFMLEDRTEIIEMLNSLRHERLRVINALMYASENIHNMAARHNIALRF